MGELVNDKFNGFFIIFNYQGKDFNEILDPLMFFSLNEIN